MEAGLHHRVAGGEEGGAQGRALLVAPRSGVPGVAGGRQGGRGHVTGQHGAGALSPNLRAGRGSGDIDGGG